MINKYFMLYSIRRSSASETRFDLRPKPKTGYRFALVSKFASWVAVPVRLVGQMPCPMELEGNALRKRSLSLGLR
jgi:hypothetical protein